MPNIKISPQQEMLGLQGRPFITREYDITRAREAAQRRKQRKGELAIPKRTQGFMRQAERLWIPKSGTENSAVILSPEAKLERDKHMIRGLVQDKYEGTDVAPARARQWGNFAARAAEEKTFGTQLNYIIDARKDFVNLCGALEKGSLAYDGDAIRASEPALGGIASYLIYLRAFIGAGKDDAEKRKWMQKRWVNVWGAEEDRARSQIEIMPNHELEGFYDEALYNSWSREQYWQEREEFRKEAWRKQGLTEPAYDPVPLEAYEYSLDGFSLPV